MDFKDDRLTASATFQTFDCAESSFTIREAKSSSVIPFNSVLNDLQDLSIENDKRVVELLPETIAEQGNLI